jgi:hypothetical protein
MPIILATQEGVTVIRRITVQSQPGQIMKSYLEKPFMKNWAGGRLKVKA